MVFKRIDRRLIANFDWMLLFSMLALCLSGLCVIYSAGYDPQSGTSPAMIKQSIAMGIGLGAFLFCMLINWTFWRRSAFLFYFLGLGLLGFVVFNGVVAGGARRWIDIGAFRMQPSEFMKVGIILVFARIFSSESAPKDGYTFWTMLYPCSLLVVPTILIMRQPDLGTALCLLLIGGSMLLMAGVKRGTLIRLCMTGILLSVPAWSMMKDYQRKRVLTFISPEIDPLGSGYHAIQSKIAVGSGAVTGKGYLQGTQTQLRFLPEQTTDFIFSVLAEEWGFIGSLFVIVLYGILVGRLLSIASRCEERFPAFVTIGVAAMMFWHCIINIGMVIGVMPVVGVTLKLFSYGGSSLISAMAAIGLVAGFTVRRYMFS